MKGRPLTAKEFERMLKAVATTKKEKKKGREVEGQKLTPKEHEESWRLLPKGYWWGGHRLAEALELRWDTSGDFTVDLDPKPDDEENSYPVCRIRAEGEKGNRDRILPMAPEFAKLLQEIPEAGRHGFVFDPRGERGGSRRSDNVGATICQIGKEAEFIVDGKSEKFATGQDLRRSFGERWASTLMPQTLMLMMRHENINTTLRYIEMLRQLQRQFGQLQTPVPDRVGTSVGSNQTGEKNASKTREKE